jgi:hypothetical protein
VISSIIRRIALGLAAAAVLATCASLTVVALALTLYALVRPYIGPAGAAASVAGACAIVLALGVLGLSLAARQRTSRIVPKGSNPAERIANFVREKPVTATLGAVGAGFLAIRNPKYLGAAIRSFLEGREGPRRRR